LIGFISIKIEKRFCFKPPVALHFSHTYFFMGKRKLFTVRESFCIAFTGTMKILHGVVKVYTQRTSLRLPIKQNQGGNVR